MNSNRLSPHQPLTPEKVELLRKALHLIICPDGESGDVNALCDLAAASFQMREVIEDMLAEIDNAKLSEQNPDAIAVVLARDSALESDMRRVIGTTC